jgi:hypothetical protein
MRKNPGFSQRIDISPLADQSFVFHTISKEEDLHGTAVLKDLTAGRGKQADLRGPAKEGTGE